MKERDESAASRSAGRRKTRAGGGAARRAARTRVDIETARYIERNVPNFELLDEEALEIIESNAETVLAEIGVDFVDNALALDLWRGAGAEVDGNRRAHSERLGKKALLDGAFFICSACSKSQEIRGGRRSQPGARAGIRPALC